MYATGSTMNVAGTLGILFSYVAPYDGTKPHAGSLCAIHKNYMHNENVTWVYFQAFFSCRFYYSIYKLFVRTLQALDVYTEGKKRKSVNER